MPEYRQPTVAEAVHLIMISLTRQYRRECLRFWAERYGREFADQVRAEVEKRWKGKR